MFPSEQEVNRSGGLDYQAERPAVPSEAVVTPPISELLLAEPSESSSLPAEIMHDPKLRAEADLRRHLSSLLEGVDNQVSDVEMDFDDAFANGLISAEQLSELYLKLADFLEADKNNARLMLYLPFEMLPHRTKTDKAEPLASAEEKFVRSYRTSWQRLLNENDIRANFVDGDILEPELRNDAPQIVRKAAHLIPDLVRKGILETTEVVDLLEKSQDETLTSSLLDALLVLADLGLLPKREWRRLFFSEDRAFVQASFDCCNGLSDADALEKDEIDRLFKLLDAGSYQGQPAQEMFAKLEGYLQGISLMISNDLLSEEDTARAADAILAGMRFWSTNGVLTETGLLLAKMMPASQMGKTFNSFDAFEERNNEDQVQNWVKSWNRKFLAELSGKPSAGNDDLHSSEVMDLQQVWTRLEAARAKLQSPNVSEEVQDPETLAKLPSQIDSELKRIDDHYQQLEVNSSDITPERIAWERQNTREQLHKRYAKMIGSAIEKRDLGPDDIESFISEPGSAVDCSAISVMAISGAIEKLAMTDIEKAKDLSRSYEPLLEQLWLKADPRVVNALITSWSHWARLKVIEDSFLEQHNVRIPKLDSAFSIGGESNLRTEIEALRPTIEAMENDPRLSSTLYPVFVLYGSKIKGYALPDADLELAAFIQPDTPWDDRTSLLQDLHRVCPADLGKVTEFWLEKKPERLGVRDLPLTENTIAEEDWVHILTQGVWYGDRAKILELISGLLPGYLSPSGKSEDEFQDDRKKWLGEIEREVLQYRLMHKGYSRFFPRRGGIYTKHSDRIDSESDFWDPGYRRLATKLFIDKVFLPEVEGAGK